MRVVVAILIAGFTGTCVASESIGNINILGVNAFDEALIQLTDNDSYAVCAQNFRRYAADLKTENGRSMYSLMMSAQAQGKKLKIVGKNKCDVRGDAESIQYIEILN